MMFPNETSAPAFAEKLASDGFAIIPRLLDDAKINFLLAQLDQVCSAQGAKQRGNSYFGIRDLLNAVPAIRDLANSLEVRSVIEPLIGRQAVAVRGIFFDKTFEANWKVAWHQDLTIAVCRQEPTEGFTCWSVKAGITHVQPPAWVLENIVTLRIHLDDTDEANGALKVIPGSHQLGRIAPEKLEAVRTALAPIVCSVNRGGALLMKPLLLHSSSPSLAPSHRRVIHLEFASVELPGSLEWYGS
ncbi:MAG: phytanoyl-CoA dioxygenase family protein [Acidobacteriota bacterium]